MKRIKKSLLVGSILAAIYSVLGLIGIGLAALTLHNRLLGLVMVVISIWLVCCVSWYILSDLLK